MARAAVALAAGIVVVAAIVLARPFLAEKRDYPSSIPQPAPLFFTQLVQVKPGQSACFTDAVIGEHSEEARFQVGTLRRPGIPLELTIRGRGYTHTARVTRYSDNDVVRVPVPRPSRSTRIRACIRNVGDRRFDLYGAADRTKSRSRAYVDGRYDLAGIQFGFWERTPRSIWERLPETMKRISTFRPPFVTPGLMWVLAVLFALGMPVAVVWGFARSLRDQD